MALLFRIPLVIIIVGIGTLAVAYAVWSAAIGSHVERLTENAGAPAGGLITAERIAALPPPAARYFTRAGVIGTSIPRTVRLHQKGRIRSSASAGWMTLEAIEVYSTNPPAFVWRAGIPGLALPLVLGRDEYLGGDGSIAMKLLSLVPVADEHGDELRAAGLMRYLNEMMWFPAAYLGDNVTIFGLGDDAFGVRISDGDLMAEGTLVVDDLGRVVNFRAQRYNTGSRRMETWETPISAWKVMAGIELPATGAADWKLPDGDLRYIELEITEVAFE